MGGQGILGGALELLTRSTLLGLENRAGCLLDHDLGQGLTPSLLATLAYGPSSFTSCADARRAGFPTPAPWSLWVSASLQLRRGRLYEERAGRRCHEAARGSQHRLWSRMAWNRATVPVSYFLHSPDSEPASRTLSFAVCV